MSFWQSFVGKGKHDGVDDRPVAWVVHAKDHERAQMKDILERNGYAVTEFKFFNEAVMALTSLETAKKGHKKGLKAPELITSDLNGSRHTKSGKNIVHLIEAIEDKGIGHVILSHASLYKEAIMDNDINAYLDTGVPATMQKTPELSETEFMSKVRTTIAAAKEQQQKVSGRINDAGESTGPAI